MRTKKRKEIDVLEDYSQYIYKGPIYHNGCKFTSDEEMVVMATSKKHAQSIFLHRLTQGKEPLINWVLPLENIHEITPPEQEKR